MLIEQGLQDLTVLALTSDSRGSASIAPFARALPDQEVFAWYGLDALSLTRTARQLVLEKRSK